MQIRTIQGKLNAQGLKIAIVASRFNNFIVDHLIKGAVDCLMQHGADLDDLTLIKVSGAFELPLLCRQIAAKNSYRGIIALGAIIRGATPHFDYVASEAVKGLAQISLQYAIPVGFGLLTTDNLEQAIERAGSKIGNKGAEAALAMLETVRVLEQI